MNRGLLLRIGAAVAILISGIVHLDLYFGGYRSAGDANFGRSILLNAIAAGVIAVALVARRDWFVKAAGIGLAVSTSALFFYTHAENSFLGFTHVGAMFEPSPQAQIALIAQIVAVVLLAVSFAPAMEAEDSTPVPLAAVGAAFAVSAIALIGLSVRWDRDTPQLAGGADSVGIADFSFVPGDLSVSKGTTITWTNADSAPHSIVAEDTSFISENLDQGGSFGFTFDTEGAFPYVCGIHPDMKGLITVTG